MRTPQRESRFAAMAAAMTIGLLIVGDADLRLALGEQFARVAAIAVEEAEAAREALTRIESGSPDVLLIADDIEAPGAATLLQMARAAGFNGPAILLAGFEAAPPEGFDGGHAPPHAFRRADGDDSREDRADRRRRKRGARRPAVLRNDTNPDGAGWRFAAF